METIAIFLTTGFEEIEAITLVDVLRRAGLKVIMVSLTDDYTVNGQQNIPVKADKLFSDVDYEQVDMLLLPGGSVGVKNLFKHEELHSLLHAFDQKKKMIAAICAAPMLPGWLGLLKGKKATCYPGCEKELLGAEVVDEPVVVDGHFITGRGIGAALAFALQITRMLKGEEKARHLARSMVVDNWEN